MNSSGVVLPADFTPELDISARQSTWQSTFKQLTRAVVGTGLQYGRVEGRSVTMIGCINGPRLTDAQPIRLRVLRRKNASDDGLPQFLGESGPVRKYQGDPVSLVAQVRITFRCDDEGDLWPRVEHIFFEGKRHISE